MPAKPGIEGLAPWARLTVPAARVERAPYGGSNMPVFEIRTAEAFLAKLREEESDFADSAHLSERHALNAILTAYHLHEWVWAELVKGRRDLHAKWGLRRPVRKDSFLRFVISRCPELKDAESITNGTKHFGATADATPTGLHKGAFSSEFSRAFDISYLWVERSGKRERAEDFIRRLAQFWTDFIPECSVTAAPQPDVE